MLGTSRNSLSTLQSALAGRQAEAGFADAAADLLALAAAIAGDRSLRTALVDAGQAAANRQNLVRELFGGKVGAIALDTLLGAVDQRWAEDFDLVEALEALAAQAVFAEAGRTGELDRLEEEIFHFGRAVDANPELQMALTNPALPGAAKSAVVRDVLADRAHPGTRTLLSHLAANLRGRRVDAAVAGLSQIAAATRDRLVAQVRVALPLTAEQSSRLAAALSRLSGRAVSLNVVVDPSIIGGVSVRLGDEIIDGSVRTRLDQARRTLVG